jgi:hypothetical protein
MTTPVSQTVSSKPEYSKKTNVINAAGDPTQSLQDFVLPDLQQFTRESAYSNTASKDFHLFYVGRDNVHEVLKYVLSRVSVSLYMNMYGYDDQELNDIIMTKIKDPAVTVVITLDKSQANGPHEKALLDQDRNGDLKDFNTHVAIGQSATHQISHTKGFVADGKVGGEGSVNWSASGEGEFPNGAWQVTGASTPAGPVSPGKGYKAQNNTQSVFTDQDTINRFQTELIAEHLIAQKQAAGATTTSGTTATKPAAAGKTTKTAGKTKKAHK